MAHRRVERRREEKCDPSLIEAALDDGRLRRHVDTQRLEQVGAPAAARHRAVAMLGHAHAARRQDQRGNGRDVERVCPVSTRSARVEYRCVGSRQLRRPLAHRPGQADDFRRALPFHGQPNQQRGDLGRQRTSVHDLGHRQGRFVSREVLTPLQFLEQ